MKYKIEVITLSEYKKISEERRAEYDFVIQHGNACPPKDVLNIGELTSCSFGFVKDLQYLYAQIDIDAVVFFNKFYEILESGRNIKQKDVENLSIFAFYSQLFWFSSQIRKINELELNLITRQSGNVNYPDGSVFEKYGSFVQMLTLANDDITKINKVRELDYSLCYSKLLYIKDVTEYEQDFRMLNKK